jgi:rhamnulokinase
MISGNEISDLQTARQLIEHSFLIKKYEPKEKIESSSLIEKFKQAISMKEECK